MRPFVKIFWLLAVFIFLSVIFSLCGSVPQIKLISFSVHAKHCLSHRIVSQMFVWVQFADAREVFQYSVREYHIFVAIRPSGNGRINEVTPRRARWVLRRVTVRGYTALVCNQPLGPTQPPALCGMGNEYWPRGNGWEGNRRRSGQASQPQWYIHLCAQWPQRWRWTPRLRSCSSIEAFTFTSTIFSGCWLFVDKVAEFTGPSTNPRAPAEHDGLRTSALRQGQAVSSR